MGMLYLNNCLTRVIFLCCAFPTFCIKANSQTNSEVSSYIYPSSGVQIGQGWDSFNSQAAPATCVIVDEVRLEQESYSSAVEQIQSTYSLTKKFTTSVSGSYNGAGGGVSGSLSTSKQASINSDYQNFLFTFESSNGSTFAASPQDSDHHLFAFTEPMIKLMDATKSSSAQENLVEAFLKRPISTVGAQINLDQASINLLKNPDDPTKLKRDKVGNIDVAAFRKKCGDGFVVAIHRGSRVNLLLTQKYDSKESKESLEASLSASGYGASGSVSYSSAKAEFTAVNQLGYRVIQEGGIPLAPKALLLRSVGESKTDKAFFDVNDILPKPDQLLANPTAFKVDVIPYSNIFDGLESNLPSPGELFTIGDYYIALNDIYNLLGGIISDDLAGSYSIKQSKPAQFDSRMIQIYAGNSKDSRPNKLQTLHDEMWADLVFLENILYECHFTKTECTPEKAIKNVVDNYKTFATASTANSDVSKNDATSKKLKELIELYPQFLTANGGLSDGFFLRFYYFLANMPLPKVAYSKVPTFDTITKLEAMADTPDADLFKIKDDVVSELARANLAFRMMPWRDFFCKEQKSTRLCVSNSLLENIEIENLQVIDNSVFTFKKNPPPPQKMVFPIDRCSRSPKAVGCLL
jgi:hypothetical protein